MKIALQNLKAKAASNTNKSNLLAIPEPENFVIPTHLYVKFTPKTEEEEAALKRDSTRVLFDYPLDYDFPDGALENRPALEEGQFPEYYAAIKIDSEEASEAQYDQLLEELFIPDDLPLGTKSKGKFDEKLVNALVAEAFNITGNKEELEENPNTNMTGRWIFGTKWNPSGTLQIWDDNAGKTEITQKVFVRREYYTCDPIGGPIRDPGGAGWLKSNILSSDNNNNNNNNNNNILPSNQCSRDIYEDRVFSTNGKYVPLVGAQVLIRQWFTVRQAITDQNGYFRTASVRGKARYIIQWERYHYSIRGSALFQAETRGPNVKQQEWNLSIKGGEAQYYGTIHHAAHHYYYQNIKGLKRPPKNGFGKPQMKIGAYTRKEDVNGVHQKNLRIFVAFPRIIIFDINRATQDTYGTTIHELAHASHWELRKNDWSISGRTHKKVIESWATGVQWELTRIKYPNYKGRGWSNGDYTLIVADLIDPNYSSDGNQNYGLYNDNVQGYTIKQIEDVLGNTSSWTNWRDNLKNTYENGTENNLDALFNYWSN